MKRLIVTVLLSIVGITVYAQAKSGSVCNIGFTYEISQSSNWGQNQPVVTSVQPYSSAESAGIKPNDIIETIDGVSTLSVQPEEIPQLLNRSGNAEVVLGIRNLESPFKDFIIQKECKKADAMTESQLASAFAMYSLETTNERTFVCPFKYTTMPDINFADFKTYAFTVADPSNEALESVINECIGKELTKKGLIGTSDNPDLLIQTFYFFDKNPNYQGENKILIDKQPVYRFNPLTKAMEIFPFKPLSAAEAEAEYLLQLGFRFIDRRDPDKNKLQVIWECEANEMLNEPYKLQEYARIFIPLMCMQYPYVKSENRVRYKVNYKTYNYTGISYDINQLTQVMHVERNSPAYMAGIRNRDVIVSINGHSLDHTDAEFTAAYKEFVQATMKYRDPATRFTNSDGFKYCMFWDKLRYPKIADTLDKKKYLPAFSYLYYFEPYINPTTVNACNFIVRRGRTNVKDITIRPIIRGSVTIEVE